MTTLHRLLDWLLQWTVILLMVTLTVIVILAVFARKFGASLVWYDEVASVLLAWVTYYGAALAALKRRHIGFDGLLLRFPVKLRMAAVVVAEILVIGFFVLLAWTGLEVLAVVGGDTLVSLTWVPISLTQSVIPITAASATAGWAIRAFSKAGVEIHSPPDLTTSLARSAISM